MLSLRWQDSFGGGGDDRRFKGEGFRSSLRFDLEKISVRFLRYPYMAVVLNFSQSWALYCLVQFYAITKDELAHIKPLYKFVTFKSIVFLTWWQGVAIALLYALGLFKSPIAQALQFQSSVQDFIICIEMGIASVVHLYVFPATPYELMGERFHGSVAMLGDCICRLERPTKLRLPQPDIDVRSGMSIRESVRDVFLGGGEYGFTYPVKAHFLEDVLDMTGYKLTSINQIDDYGQEKMWKTQRQLVPRKRKNQITALVEIEFYKKEDVLEGCVIIKKHIPITNLFTCLWFNEVDRFTSGDQLSFSTVQDRIMAEVNWSVDMFMDCERRNFVIQLYSFKWSEYYVSEIALSVINLNSFCIK
ncbi:hypothetical protein ACSBR1_038295 [Camellia fascicularis]